MQESERALVIRQAVNEKLKRGSRGACVLACRLIVWDRGKRPIAGEALEEGLLHFGGEKGRVQGASFISAIARSNTKILPIHGVNVMISIETCSYRQNNVLWEW